jgi:1,4-alpha-glucan branching enzyme
MANPRVQEKRSKQSKRSVSFIARVGDAKAVSVTGDFTGWSEEGVALQRESKGEWKTSLDLAPGEYQYRIRVDGQWQDHAEAQKRVPNPFGSENGVLVVT